MQKAQRKPPAQSEVDIQRDVLALLKRHPAIAWAKRMNVGGVRKPGGRWIDFGFVGCSDIIGQTRTGLFFACEVKRPGEGPSTVQIEFLKLVAENLGVAIVACDLEELTKQLNSVLRAATSPELARCGPLP